MISKKDIVSASIKLALAILSPLLIIIVVDGKFNNLEAYIDSKIIGYVENRGETVQVYNELITDISTAYENVNLEKHEVEFKKIKENTILLSNKKEIQKGILESITGKARAFELNIRGKNFGYINSTEKVNDVLKLVTDKYIEGLDIAKEDLISADIECKIDVKETTINIANIKTQDEISNEIYERSVNEEGLLNIDIKVKETVEEEIPADTIVVNDDTMYLGQIEEKIGESGKKLVFKEVVYSNGELVIALC